MASILIALFVCTRSAIMSYKSKHSTPSEERQHTPKGETLREKASRKLHGKDANPSQLGDPISLKAETSSLVPTEEEEGAQTHGNAVSSDEGYGSKGNLDDNLRKQAVEAVKGATQQGDPASGKVETSDLVPTEGDEGAHKKRDSKL